MTATLPAGVSQRGAGDPVGTVRPVPGSHALRWAILWTIGFGGWFIARASTVIDGRRTFTLFDDALVSMRYARNLASGHGLVWNPGEPGVEGYSNFLWTLWLAVLHKTGASVESMGLLVSLSGLATLVANLVVIARLCRRLAPDRPIVLRVAMLLTATCYPLLFWTLRGMEVGLVALVLSASVLYALRAVDGDGRAFIGLAIAGVVGVLTRTDVIVPVGVVATYAFIASPRWRRRDVAIAGLAPLAAIAVHTLLRWRWYGAKLPNTYHLKLGGVLLGDRLHRGAAVALLLLSVQLIVPIGLAIVAMLGARRATRHLVLPIAVFGSCLAYAMFVGGDAWEWMRIPDRYITPGLPLLFLVSAFGVDQLWRADGATRRRVLVIGAGVVCVGAVIAQVDPFPHALLQFSPSGTGFMALPLLLSAVVMLGLAAVSASSASAGRGEWARAGGLAVAVALVASTSLAMTRQWYDHNADHVSDDVWVLRIATAINESTTPETTIAVAWAGSIPYYTDRPAIDLLGKNDPVIAHSPVLPVPLYPGHMRWNFNYSIYELRPDVIAGIVYAGPAEMHTFETWGYVPLSDRWPTIFVRADAPGVDLDRMRATLDAFVDRG